MQYRQLGRTGIEVSEIGYGTWPLGGGWGMLDDAESLRALHRALELGINYFDTSPLYGDGHAERLVGRAVAGRRDRVVIATRVPPKNYRWPVLSEDPITETFPADWIVECTEQSLKNLGTDYIDVQHLGAWTPKYTEQLEWYEAMSRLKNQGKIRAFGVSANDWDPYGPTDLVRSGLVDTVQVIYNIFEQRPAETLLPEARQHEVGVIGRVPLEEGILTGRIGPDTKFPRGDWRIKWLTPLRLREVAERVERLKPFLADDRPTLTALALKFSLSHPAISTIIPGMRSVDHVEANVAVSDGKLLPDSVLEALKAHAFVHGWSYPWCT